MNGAMTAKSKNVVTWVLTAIAAGLILLSAVTKLNGNEEVQRNFMGWGYSDSFRVFIGVCEAVGAVGLLLPPFAPLAGAGLSIIMAGAVFTHLTHDQAGFALVPLTLLAILLYVTHARRGEVGRLFGRPAAAHK